MNRLEIDRPDYKGIFEAPTTAAVVGARPMLRVRVTGQTGNVGRLLAHLPPPQLGGSTETDLYEHTFEVMLLGTSAGPLLDNIDDWLWRIERFRALVGSYRKAHFVYASRLSRTAARRPSIAQSHAHEPSSIASTTGAS